MRTVADFFEWKEQSGKTHEQMHEEKTLKLGWEYTDTMYSFLGIYLLGANAYYPDEFKRTERSIRRLDGKTAYSNEYMKGQSIKYYELNNLTELNKLISELLEIGNLMPIWPGGNRDKGLRGCFDIPEIYFEQNKMWGKELERICAPTFLEDIIDNKNEFSLNKLINMDREEYKSFLSQIVATIQMRTEKIKKRISSNGEK